MDKFLVTFYKNHDKLLSLIFGGNLSRVLVMCHLFQREIVTQNMKAHVSIEPISESSNADFIIEEGEELRMASTLVDRYYLYSEEYYQVTFPLSRYEVHSFSFKEERKVVTVRCDSPMWLRDLCQGWGAEVRDLPLECTALGDLLDYNLTQQTDRLLFVSDLKDAWNNSVEFNGSKTSNSSEKVKEAKEAEASKDENSDSPKTSALDPLNAMIHAHFDSLGELLKKFERKGALAMLAWLQIEQAQFGYSENESKFISRLASQMKTVIEGRYGK